MKNYHSLFLFIVLSFSLIFYIYWSSLYLPFVQDDFYLLKHSRIGETENIGKLFLPQNDTVWYRPLSQYIFFYTMQTIFGLHAFPFHLVILLVHGVNSIVLFLILKKLFKNKLLAIIGGMIYALHPLQFVSLVWPAAFSFVLGPFFFLITIYSVLFLINNFTIRQTVLVYIFYLLSLFTTEVNLLLILIVPLLLLLLGKSKKYAYYFFIAGFLPVACIIYLRLFAFPIHLGGDYGVNLGGLGVSVRYYLLRIIGIPLVYRQIKLIQLLEISIPSGVMLLYFITSFVYSIKIKNPHFLFGLVLSCVGIIPFILMPQHLSPHYAVYSLIGIIIFVSAQWAEFVKKNKKFNKISLGVIFILTLLVLSKTSFLIEWQTHWIISRAKLADHLLKMHTYTAPIGTEEYFALGANSTEDLFAIKVIQ